MAQLLVAQEEEHRKHFTDFCIHGNTMERVHGATCMYKNCTEMGGVMQCTVIWRLDPHHKLCVYSRR